MPTYMPTHEPTYRPTSSEDPALAPTPKPTVTFAPTELRTVDENGFIIEYISIDFNGTTNFRRSSSRRLAADVSDFKLH